MVDSTKDKLLWMNKNLQDAWKADQSKDLTWLLEAASTLGQFAIGKAAPDVVPKGLLNKAAKMFSSKAGELVAGGHGIFNRDALQMTAAQKEQLKNEKALFKAVGQGTFLIVWAVLGSTAPVLGGVVLVTAGLKYLFKLDKIASQKRWEDITARIMERYSDILDMVAAKKAAASEFSKAVEQIRLEDEFVVERNQDAKPVAPGVDLTVGAKLRLFIYFDYYLNLKVGEENSEFSYEQLADLYAIIGKDVDAYSDNSLKFDAEHGVDYRDKQSDKVAAFLTNVD